MAQTIIAYIIIAAAVGYTVYSVAKKLRTGSSSKDGMSCGTTCSDCSCCVKNAQCKTKKQ